MKNYIYGLEFVCHVCRLYGKRNDVKKLEEHLRDPHANFQELDN